MSGVSRRSLLAIAGAGAVATVVTNGSHAEAQKEDDDRCQVFFGIHPVVGPDEFTMEVDHQHPASLAHACHPNVCLLVSVKCLVRLRPTLWRCRELPGMPRVYKACVKQECKIEDAPAGSKAEVSETKGLFLHDVDDPTKADIG